MRPGVDVITLSQPPPRSAQTYTGVWFAVGGTAIGPLEPVEVKSMQQYEDTFGDRSGGTLLYDAVDAFFREGGSTVWISAIPTTPSLMGLSVDRGDAPEPESAEPQEAKKPSARAAVVAADVKTALDRFGKAFGPGQVSAPGVTDAVSQGHLIQHAADHNRVALVDSTELGTAAQNEALAEALRTNGRHAALFGPWAIYPGVAVGTERHIPYSAVEAGIIARNDASGNANLAAAGNQGVSNLASGLTVSYTDAEYAAMNEAGFDAAKVVHGVVQTYGYRSLADPDLQPEWESFGWSRLNMAITAAAEAIGERYVFRQIDGRGLTIAQFGSELRAMLLQFYLEDALFGETPDDAFDVDVGPQVNTLERIANGELHAVLRVRMSPFSEWVVIEIVKVATTESVAVAA